MRPQILSDPVHFSNLRYMLRSPAHYRCSILEPRAQTAPMRMGSVQHAKTLKQPFRVWDGDRRGRDWDLLQAIRAGEPYTVFDGSRRGKEWTAFSEAHKGKLIVNSEERDAVMKCLDGAPADCLVATASEATLAERIDAAIWADPVVREKRPLDGEYEVPVEWTMLGRKCSTTGIDVKGNGFITELKTCSNSEPGQFLRAALRMGYHGQLAWYLDGIGQPEWAAFIVAVETAPPFAVTVIELTRKTLDEGRKLCRLAMEQLLVCEASNEWPAYCQSVVPWDLPDYDGEPLLIDGEEVAA